MNTWKNAQHCSLLEKCKTKLQWGITLHQREWPSSKNLQTVNAQEGVEKKEHSCTVGGNARWYSHCGEHYGDSLKKLGIKLPNDPIISLLVIHPEETIIEKAAVFIIDSTWKQSRCPLTDEWIKKLWNITQP